MTDVIAEITANVWQVHVEPGQAVGAGDTVAILESMKMEIPVEAPVAGTVTEVKVKPEDKVQEGDVIAVIEYVVRTERRGAVGVVTIDRPERRNALNLETCLELLAELEKHVATDARVVVLTGAGGHFCAGADLSGVEGDDFRAALRTLLDRLTTVPMPVIAAVAGAALGAGTQLAVACDLRVAAADARFGIPAAKLGLMVDHWTVQRLAAVAGHGPARLMLLAAEEVSGERAHQLGLVDRVGSLDDALAWGAGIAELAPLSIAGHKLAINRLEAEPVDADVTAAIRRAWASDDVAEGMAAFRERRPPQFRGT
jgi:enoyl-CoA hydratase